MEQRHREGLEAADPIMLELPSSPEYILVARLVVSYVGQLAGFDAEDIYDMKLAVTEAATNAIRHAEVKSFGVEYRAAPGVAEVTVTDVGGGFDVDSLTGEPSEKGGFGLAVIRSLVDEVSLDSSQKGTRIRMIRRASSERVA
jgi:serine/threonine-protein kinase RsbW